MESQYRALFLDDAIAPILLEKIAENTKEGYVTWLMSHSLLTFEQAESVFYFQMNGCLSINRLMLRNHCNDWKQIQTVIDKFIKSGLESFLIHDQREENASDNFCNKISPTVTASSTSNSLQSLPSYPYCLPRNSQQFLKVKLFLQL